MGKRNYLAEALRLKAKIERLYNYGRHTGYKQATDHLDEIGNLMRSAVQSKHGENHVPLIHSIYKEMQQLMDEWGKEDAKNG